ncbi:hypothetical protein DRN38_07585 [Thermococci archaeon]|nr:MAG: hypothetical protein DRN38_07585 [Thermococci archaeon]
MFIKRWLALLLLVLLAPSLWADDNCRLGDCRYTVSLEKRGTYIATVTLPSGQPEGVWSLTLNPSRVFPQYLNGFWAGSVLKEQQELPNWVGFSLLQRESIDVTPYQWIGDGSPLTVQIHQDIGRRLLQSVYGPTLMNPAQTYTTPPLNPGFYIADFLSQLDSPRTYQGLALEGNSLYGGVVGGYLDSSTGVGYGAFLIDSPTVVDFLLLFGESFGEFGSAQPYMEVYYQHEDGTREIYWEAPNKPALLQPPPPLALHRPHRALLGGSVVEIFQPNNLENAIFVTLIDENGYFGVDDALAGRDDNELLLVKVKLGEYSDPQDTVHAFATKAQLFNGTINISLLSDIAWQYTKKLLDNSSQRSLLLRLSDVAQVLIG